MVEQRERAINAPWPVLVLIAAILAAFAVQSWEGVDTVIAAHGFSPAMLARGHWRPVVTALFLHASWIHALSNSAFALAFGAPVARRMGENANGATAFLLFYLVCGVLANLAYAGLHPDSVNKVIGASGAVAGFMGAASRMIGRGPGQGLAPFNSPPVIGMAAAWLVVNLLFGAILAGWAPGSGGAPIAWEVHLAGYAVGLVLFSPTLRLIGRF